MEKSTRTTFTAEELTAKIRQSSTRVSQDAGAKKAWTWAGKNDTHEPPTVNTRKTAFPTPVRHYTSHDDNVDVKH